MSLEDSSLSFKWFVINIMPLIILFLGLFGNLMGIIVMLKSKIDQIPIGIYCYIFMFDSIYLLVLLENYLNYAHSIAFSLSSNFNCKILYYFGFSFSTLSSLLLIYTLIERYLAIKYPVESNLLRNNYVQFVYLIFIIITNLIYFLPSFIYSGLEIVQTNNTTREELACIINNNHKDTIQNLTFISKILLPLVLIILFSIILVYKIIKTKSKISTFYSKKENEIYRKDVHLSVVSILYNLMQFSFNFPIGIVFFILNDEKNFIYIFTLYIYYLTYAFNFYFLLVTNSLFRDEFINLMFFRRKNEKKMEFEIENILV